MVSSSAFAVAISLLALASISCVSAADSTADLVEQLAKDLSADILSQPAAVASTPVPVAAAQAQPLVPDERDPLGAKPMAGLLGKRSCGVEVRHVSQSVSKVDALHTTISDGHAMARWYLAW